MPNSAPVTPSHNKPRTLLAFARLEAGLTQKELAQAIGISIASYRRVEYGEDDDPPIGWIANAAIALELSLEDLLEEEMIEWHDYGGAREPRHGWLERPDVKLRAARWKEFQQRRGN